MLPSCGTIVEAASQRLPKAAHFLRPENAQDNKNLSAEDGGLVLNEHFSSARTHENRPAEPKTEGCFELRLFCYKCRPWEVFHARSDWRYDQVVKTTRTARQPFEPSSPLGSTRAGARRGASQAVEAKVCRKEKGARKA
jgi:hypothetical protein